MFHTDNLKLFVISKTNGQRLARMFNFGRGLVWARNCQVGKVFRTSTKCGFIFLRTRNKSSSTELPPEGLEALAFERASVLARVLECPLSYALQIISRHKSFLKNNWKHVEQTATYLGEKLELTDIAKNYEILTVRKECIEQRYTILQEIGVTDITAEDIIRYLDIVSSTPLQLKLTRCTPKEWDPTDEMLVQLQCDGNLAHIIKNKLLQQNYWTKMSIKCIRSNLLVDYLSWRLECLPENVSSLLNRHHAIGAKSFQHLQATLHFLTNEFKFSLQQIRRHFYILKASPENLQNMLDSPALAELDMKKIILTNPRTTLMSCQNLERMDQLLRSYEISKNQIHHFKLIFMLSPAVVKQRLESMQTVPELWAMKSCDRFLCLLYNYKTAQKQLDTLKQAGHLAISVSMLTKRTSEDNITTGNDKCQGKECVAYFAKFFGKSHGEVKKKLGRHPNKYRISLVNSQKIIKEFLMRGLSKTQLWNSLFIVLYDEGLVIEYFDGLKDRPELQPFEMWNDQPLLLDLIVYFIERELRFSGAGVFCTVTSHGKDAVTIQDVKDMPESDDSECVEN